MFGLVVRLGSSLYNLRVQNNELFTKQTINMKKAFSLLIVIVACCVYGMGTTNTSIPHGAEEIELHGLLDTNAGPDDVEVYVDGNFIYVSFHRNFANVNITLYNPNGIIIYTDAVNTAVQQLVIIPVSFSYDGTYTIVLENTFGYADGEYEKLP